MRILPCTLDFSPPVLASEDVLIPPYPKARIDEGLSKLRNALAILMAKRQENVLRHRWAPVLVVSQTDYLKKTPPDQVRFGSAET